MQNSYVICITIAAILNYILGADNINMIYSSYHNYYVAYTPFSF